jgi:hypothetical protein
MQPGAANRAIGQRWSSPRHPVVARRMAVRRRLTTAAPRNAAVYGVVPNLQKNSKSGKYVENFARGKCGFAALRFTDSDFEGRTEGEKGGVRNLE